MLSERDREALNTSIGEMIEIATNIKTIIMALSENRQILNKIITFEDTNRNKSYFQNLDKLIASQHKIDEFIKSINNIQNTENNIPDTFKKFLQQEFVTYPWHNLAFVKPYSYNPILKFLNKQTGLDPNIEKNDIGTINNLKEFPQRYLEYISTFETKINNYKIFDKIKDIDNNIVMIGANGSGKSTFSRNLRGKFSPNISILSAQHLLVYNKKDSIPSANNELERVRSIQKNPKMSSDGNFTQTINEDMNKLMEALIAEHTQQAYRYRETNQKKASFLERTIEIWEQLIEHRFIKIHMGYVMAQTPEGIEYLFNQLSDGEKAVFYYIAHILLVEENSYIIVDEPENHLHLAICNKLWDKLESIRTDCKFIYLTHNLEFASSRNNATHIWNKNFEAPSNWDFEIINPDDTFPNTLHMEILGSRKEICFCEGKDKSSLDYKLYSILFPNYTVIPSGGHLDVISYTNANNKSSLFRNKAIGIIDGDCHLPQQINKWEKDSIYVIPVNEIENLLCDEELITEAIKVFQSGDDAKQKYLDFFWQELTQEKELQAIWYVNNIINNRFKENFIHAKNNISELKRELLSVTSEDEIDTLYQERLAKLNQILTAKNYDDALQIINFKGKLIKHITKITIVDKYAERIIRLISQNINLQTYLKNKYLSKIT